jgi:pullulanase/glycogen debranching enzyme
VNADVRHATQLRGIFVMVSVTSANIVDTKFYQIKSEKIKYNFFGCGFFIETQIKRVTQLIVGTLLQVSDEVQR